MGSPKPDMLGGGANSNKTSDELFQMALPQDVVLDYYPTEEQWVLNSTPRTYSSLAAGQPVDVARQAISLLTEK